MANHQFIPNEITPTVCSFVNEAGRVCGGLSAQHAECECCNNFDIVTLMYGNMKMCQECKDKEVELQRANNTPEAIQQRLNATIENARAIDKSVQIRTDLFNAATISIAELKAAIDNDPSIENKPYTLATELKTRFEHYKEVVFKANETIAEAGNHQKAIQAYLNTLANQLRAEEREKLKIQDINYKPSAPAITKPKAIKTAKGKIDKAELRKYAAELKVSEFVLQMVCVQKGITPEAAANQLRRSIKEAQSIDAPPEPPTTVLVSTEPVTDMDSEIMEIE